MQLTSLTLPAIAAGLREKQFCSVELTQAYLDRIAQLNGALGTYLHVAAATALEQARVADKHFSQGETLSPLAGIPVGVKDIFCIRGVPTTAGSKILEGYVPPYTATAYQRLADAGAVLLGKLNMDEFASGSSGENSAYGTVKNPWDLGRVPGGTSGGSAAAMAADLAAYTLGTDTGGSIRQPASFCSVTGLKPSYGRVSRYGVIAMASSLDQVGAFAHTAADIALVLSAMAGVDRFDATTVDRPLPAPAEYLEQPVAGLRVGVPKEYFADGLDAGVRAQVQQAIGKLEELGAKITEVSLPMSPYGLAVYYVLMPSELSTNLARYDGIRYGKPAKTNDLVSQYLQTRGQGFGPEIRRRIMLGTHALSSGYYDAYYLQAQKVRTLVKQDFERVFEHVDCVVTPVAPSVAFRFGEKTVDPLTMYLEDVYTVPVNIAGLPGISVPCGFARPAEGGSELPVGMQLIGKQFDEPTILRLAHQYQQATDWHTRRPQL